MTVFAYVGEELVEIPDYVPPDLGEALSLPEAPTRIYKSAMFRRMTDDEYTTYEAIRAQFPPRLAALFDSVEYLSSDDEFWPSLVSAATQAYGEERAAEILAP